jgi:hypothetical protein
MSVFVAKPFVPPAPDRDPNSNLWRSGALLGYYADWRVEWCTEDIFDCMSSGVAQQHAVNRIAARKLNERPANNRIWTPPSSKK